MGIEKFVDSFNKTYPQYLNMKQATKEEVDKSFRQEVEKNPLAMSKTSSVPK